MKILCLIPMLPNEVSSRALESVLNQTVPVNHIFFSFVKNFKRDTI